MKFFRQIFAASDRGTFIDLFLDALRQSQPQAKLEYKAEEFAVTTATGRINLSA